jgi:hypothetical protein
MGEEPPAGLVPRRRKSLGVRDVLARHCRNKYLFQVDETESLCSLPAGEAPKRAGAYRCESARQEIANTTRTGDAS